MVLARYILVRMLQSIGLALAILVMLLLVVMLVDTAGDLAQEEQALVFSYHYSLAHVLEFSYQLLPVAVLMGALAGGVTMACSGELLAIAATGCRMRYVVLPMVLAFALCACCCWWLGQSAVWTIGQLRPQVQGRLASRLDRLIGQRLLTPTWLRIGSDVLWLGNGALGPNEPCYHGSMRFVLDEAGLLQDWQMAERLCLQERSWQLQQLVHYVPTPPYIYQTPAADVPMPVGVQSLTDWAKHPRQIGWLKGHQAMVQRAASGLDNKWYAVEWSSTVAHPLACLMLGLLVLPWCIHPWPRRSMAMTLGVGAVLAVVYTALGHLFRLLGLSGQLPPLVSPWIVLFSCGVATWYSVGLRRRVLGA